jgi:hypothetical protein
LLLFVVQAARADDGGRERSRASFRRGVVLAREGNYAGARDAFAEAYRLFAHPSILLNLGIARAKTDEFVAAEEDLVNFLASDNVTAEEAASARSALAEVRGHLATLHLKVTPPKARITLEGRAAKLADGKGEVRAVIGRRTLHAEAEGYEPLDESVVVNQGGLTKELTLTRKAGKATDEASVSTSDFDLKKGLGWGLCGLGVVAAGFGTFAGLRAISLADDYSTTGDPNTKSSGTTFRTLADVSFIVAAASAGVGVYFLLTPSPKTKATPALTTRAVLGPNFSGLAGSF